MKTGLFPKPGQKFESRMNKSDWQLSQMMQGRQNLRKTVHKSRPTGKE